MNLQPNFTLDELLGFLEQQQPSEQDGYRTAREWAEHLKVNERRAKILLQTAARQGKLKLEWMQREGIDGRRIRVPAYAFRLSEGE